MPTLQPTLSRRRVLMSATVLALLGATATTACGSSSPPPEVGELAAQLDRARADSQLATDAAASARPGVAEALNIVASERSAHAQALSDELVRMVGQDAPTATPTAKPAKAPTVHDVIGALRASAENAAELAVKFSGYRAGLLGSIAAAGTAAYTVALVPPGGGAMASPAPTPTTTTPTTAMTTTTTPSRVAEPTSAARPAKAADGALFDALVTEHATIYGYGLVSAHSIPDVNELVSSSMREHRERRDATIAMLEARSVDAPLPAAGYQLPMEVDEPTDAANLAVRMEDDTAAAWRAVVEQATHEQDRAYAVTALTQSAVRAARWRRLLGVSPITVSFPGGSE